MNNDDKAKRIEELERQNKVMREALDGIKQSVEFTVGEDCLYDYCWLKANKALAKINNLKQPGEK